MAFRLACEMSDRIAAIGVVAGSLETGCEPSRPAPVLLIHGDADEIHPLEGGSGPNSIARVEFNSVPATMETWWRANGCASEPDVSVAGDVTTTRWTGCDGGVDVELRLIAGGSHAWPGGDPLYAFSSEPSQAMDATAVVWEWVSGFSRSAE